MVTPVARRQAVSHARTAFDLSERRARTSLAHTRAVLAAWRDDYNHVRLHGALGGLTPVKAAALARIIHNEHNHNAGPQP